MARDESVQIIEPATNKNAFKLHEVWFYKDLIYLFVHRDFVAQYKQTILGPLWHFVQPLLTTVIFTFVFGTIAQLSTDGIPPFLFYMAGTVIWSYFSSVLTSVANTFTSNAQLFGKVYFPRLVMPISTVISQLIAFGIQLFFFLCFLAYFKMTRDGEFGPTLFLLWIPLLVVMMAALALSLGVIVSSMTAKYRDLSVLVGFGVQLYMYLCPVVYPVSSLEGPWRTAMLFNPAAPIIEGFRYAFLGTGYVSMLSFAYSLGIIILLFLFGVYIFNKVERTFMDTV